MTIFEKFRDAATQPPEKGEDADYVSIKADEAEGVARRYLTLQVSTRSQVESVRRIEPRRHGA